MKKILVYDFPTRVFHWFFAIFFIGAFFIAKFIDDDSPIYPYHMMMGFIMTFMVILRIFWGFTGSRWSRFSSFTLKPRELKKYIKDLIYSKTQKYTGHNPASSWAAVLMIFLTFGLAFTGYMMTSDNKAEFFEGLHEIFSTIFITIVIVHVLGVIFHTLRHRDNLAMSMINGKKIGLEEKRICKPKIISGLVFLCLIGLFTLYLYNHYNPTTGKLTIFNNALQLSEVDDEVSTHEYKDQIKEREEKHEGKENDD